MKVVATSGCFDIFHDAHVNLLHACRRIGDTVVVFLNSDESVTRIKGEGRPRMPFHVRRAVVEACKHVDAIVPFGEDTPAKAIRNYIKCNGHPGDFFWVKGADSRITGLPDDEKNAVIESGGTILFYDNPSNTHATEIHGKITKSHRAAAEIQEILEEVT